MSDELKAAWESIWLSGEEQKYEVYIYSETSAQAQFYTRGRWWLFEYSPQEWNGLELAKAIKSHISANAILTTMYGA